MELVFKGRLKLTLLFFAFGISCKIISVSADEVDPSRCEVWGPGLRPDKITLPARYFFIHAVSSEGKRLSSTPSEQFAVQITGDSDIGSCRLWTQVLNRRDGSFIVRYKMYHSCQNLKIHINYKGKPVAHSPYQIKGPTYSDECYCPVSNLKKLVKDFECPKSYEQINNDLSRFDKVDIDLALKESQERFKYAGSYSFCHYAVQSNKVYRKCYGQHVGFKMFMDNILLSLARKAVLPDLEFLVNLGDWPLIKKDVKPVIPMFSWCGSETTADIVMPTYDITESSQECMGRVTLDMLSVQANSEKPWDEKSEKVFWRGRDSRRERLDLIKIARQHPDLFNASLTNFFFFRDEEKIYGPKEPHVSFFKFFDYKYQLNIDGTVAAYRFPYLLAGDSVVLKQDSPYYEHFYKQLKPWTHYIPVKADLSDLVEKADWARSHDEEAQQISIRGRMFARQNLLPRDIFCYHAVLFQEWSKRLKDPVQIRDGMEEAAQPKGEQRFGQCKCHQQSAKSRDEL